MAKTKLLINESALTDQVSEHYKKFFNKFREIDTVSIKEWKVVHLLAYLCRKYEAYYGLKYSFRFNNPTPSKSYEVYQIKKLASMLSSDPQILKNYLDWVFDKKIFEKKKIITSLGYFTHIDIVNDFKFKFLFNKKEILRTDRLEQNIVSICTRHGHHVKTYGDLAFIKRMLNQEDLFSELLNIKFPIDILDKIK